MVCTLGEVWFHIVLLLSVNNRPKMKTWASPTLTSKMAST